MPGLNVILKTTLAVICEFTCVLNLWRKCTEMEILFLNYIFKIIAMQNNEHLKYRTSSELWE